MAEAGITILVASDDLSEIAGFLSELQKEQFRTVAVAQREMIVTLCRSEMPSLIILDLMTPFNACRVLKKSFVTESIPIIALLAKDDEIDKVVLFEFGVDDCVVKPCSSRELILRIKASLSRMRDKMGRSKYKRSQHYSALTRPTREASLTDDSKD